MTLAESDPEARAYVGAFPERLRAHASELVSVVQILAHVLQACCCPGEKSSRSKWHEEQPAGSCRPAQNLRERPPADPTLLIGPTSAFDTGD
jgi:hypothetical protein